MRYRQTLCTLAVFLLLVGYPVLAQRVVVISSYNDPPYQKALSGIAQGLGKISFETYTLPAADETNLKQTVQTADTVLLSLGARATDFILGANPNPALVGCLLLSSEPLRQLPRAQAATLDIGAEQQVLWLKKLLPRARDIGIVYDPGQNGKRVEALATALRKAGLRPVLQAVRTPNELPGALDKLSNEIDVLLGLPDATVFTTQTSKAILLYSFRQRIPLIGLSESWVKAGALYALEWDYEEMGRYCGQMAARLASTSRSTPPMPAKFALSLNLRTAGHMKINWSDELIQTAAKTYE